MPQPFTIYHFLPLTHHRGAVPIVEELLTQNHRPILDLEDSVSCIFDPERNDHLKATARKGLLRLADALKAPPLPHETILVRINQRDSHHYPLDIDAIVACHQRGFSPSVLLSKTHCADDLRQCQNELISRLKKAVPVVPIIESQRGLDRLEDTAIPQPENEAAQALNCQG